MGIALSIIWGEGEQIGTYFGVPSADAPTMNTSLHKWIIHPIFVKKNGLKMHLWNHPEKITEMHLWISP